MVHSLPRSEEGVVEGVGEARGERDGLEPGHLRTECAQRE